MFTSIRISSKLPPPFPSSVTQTPDINYNIFLLTYLKHLISQGNLHINIFATVTDGGESENLLFFPLLTQPLSVLYLGNDIKSSLEHSNKTKASWQDDFGIYSH